MSKLPFSVNIEQYLGNVAVVSMVYEGRTFRGALFDCSSPPAVSLRSSYLRSKPTTVKEPITPVRVEPSGPSGEDCRIDPDWDKKISSLIFRQPHIHDVPESLIRQLLGKRESKTVGTNRIILGAKSSIRLRPRKYVCSKCRENSFPVIGNDTPPCKKKRLASTENTSPASSNTADDEPLFNNNRILVNGHAENTTTFPTVKFHRVFGQAPSKKQSVKLTNQSNRKLSAIINKLQTPLVKTACRRSKNSLPKKKSSPRCQVRIREYRLPDGRKFRSNEIVWAKLGNHPVWPAKVLSIIQHKDTGCVECEVSWFGEGSVSIVVVEKVWPFGAFFRDMYAKRSKVDYQNAVKAACKTAGVNLPGV